MDDVEVPAANMLPNVKGFKVGGQRIKVNLKVNTFGDAKVCFWCDGMDV